MTNEYHPPAEVQAAIDQMLAGADSAPAPTRVRQQHASIRLDHDGNVAIDGDAYDDGEVDTLEAVHIPAERSRLNGLVTAIEERLSAVTFDPATGKPQPKLTGSDRVVAERELAQLRETVAYQHSVLDRAEAARAAAAAAKNAEDAIRMAESAWTRGDSRRAAMLREEVERAEARELAAQILAARMSKGDM